MSVRDGVAEWLLVDALGQHVAEGAAPAVLLLGMQACATVAAVNRRFGAANVALLHLDRAAGGVGCGLGNAEAYLSGDTLAPRPEDAERYALVGFNVEAARGYRVLREIIAALPGYLEPGGSVLVAGPRKGGAEVAATALRAVFGSVALLAYRKGHRVYRAAGPRQSSAEAESQERGDESGGTGDTRAAAIAVSTSLRGHDVRLVQDQRIFARGRLDPAAALLAGSFQVPPGAAVLDLGCGSGVLGILAALLEPTSQVTLVDADPLAVEASRRNAVLNGVRNVTVVLSDVLRDLPGRVFDVVLMNPPFHRGRTQDVGIAHRFIAEAGAALRPGGRVYVVCNRFLRYEPVLEHHIGSVQELAGNSRYKVLLGERRT